MNLAKTSLLRAYSAATFPWRWWAAERRARQGRAPVMILFYHRVADTWPNDWTIGTRQFARQMAWLRRHFDMVSLSEAQRRIRSGENRQACVTITFDDGYAENTQFALPLLVEKKIPCAYFVSTHHVLTQRPFPHDCDAERPLPVNTPDELCQWAERGIDIGSHTRTHLDLGSVTDRHTLEDEIVGSKRDLEALLERPVRYFAFPYGMPQNVNPVAVQMAREAGFTGVCSAAGEYNFPGEDPFLLRRIHGDPEMARLKNWLTLDPRKVRHWEIQNDARRNDSQDEEREGEKPLREYQQQDDASREEHSTPFTKTTPETLALRNVET